jgi:N-acetylglutamate synthase-like GNAT family acetyltransferase
MGKSARTRSPSPALATVDSGSFLRDMSYDLRPATAGDSGSIRRLISEVHINPMSLDWRRFVIAVDGAGMLLGCGQLKPHGGGILELASIAVVPKHRGQGIAGSIIEDLIGRARRPLYLTCRAHLQPFYNKWGFVRLEAGEMPPYFRRLWQLVSVAHRLGIAPGDLLVMALK